MALIPQYRVVTAMQAVDPSSEPIKEGQLVTLTAAGVSRVTTDTVNLVYGIAADNYQTTASSMPGVYPGWQNRVSDGNDETKASGKMTVYHSGGEFKTDQFTNSGTALDSTKIGAVLIANADGVLCYGYANSAAAALAGKQAVAYLTSNAQMEDSGVPGTEVNASMGLLGDHNSGAGTPGLYIGITLLV